MLISCLRGVSQSKYFVLVSSEFFVFDLVCPLTFQLLDGQLFKTFHCPLGMRSVQGENLCVRFHYCFIQST